MAVGTCRNSTYEWDPPEERGTHLKRDEGWGPHKIYRRICLTAILSHFWISPLSLTHFYPFSFFFFSFLLPTFLKQFNIIFLNLLNKKQNLFSK